MHFDNKIDFFIVVIYCFYMKKFTASFYFSKKIIT